MCTMKKCSGSQPWYLYNQVMTCVAYVARWNQVKKLKKKSDLEGARQASQNAAKLGMPNPETKRDVETGSTGWKGGMVQHFYDKGWKISWWMVMRFWGEREIGIQFGGTWFLHSNSYTVFIVYAAYTMASLRLRHPNKRYLSNQSQLYDYRIICLIFSISECFFSSKCVSLHVFWDKASHYGPSPIPNQMSNESKNPWLLGVI